MSSLAAAWSTSCEGSQRYAWLSAPTEDNGSTCQSAPASSIGYKKWLRQRLALRLHCSYGTIGCITVVFTLTEWRVVRSKFDRKSSTRMFWPAAPYGCTAIATQCKSIKHHGSKRRPHTSNTLGHCVKTGDYHPNRKLRAFDSSITRISKPWMVLFELSVSRPTSKMVPQLENLRNLGYSQFRL